MFSFGGEWILRFWGTPECHILSNPWWCSGLLIDASNYLCSRMPMNKPKGPATGAPEKTPRKGKTPHPSNWQNQLPIDAKNCLQSVWLETFSCCFLAPNINFRYPKPKALSFLSEILPKSTTICTKNGPNDFLDERVSSNWATSAMSRAHGTWKVYNGKQQAQRFEFTPWRQRRHQHRIDLFVTNRFMVHVMP